MPLVEEHVREFTRSCVRAGLLDDERLHDEVVLAIVTELPGRAAEASTLAGRWICEDRAQLAVDAAAWPPRTDYDRLQDAFAALEELGVVVLQGVDDHWAATELLDARAGDPPRGVAWFTPPDVWHAVDEGMLEVNVWHGDTANVAPGEPLLADVEAVLARHGLPAHFDEGRVEVSMHWQRRPTPSP